MRTDRDRKRALAAYLECSTRGLTIDLEDETRVCTEHSAYLVLTQAESEAAMREKLEQVRREIPEDDQERMAAELLHAMGSGYGYLLSSHDGVEGEELVDGVIYFIYRVD